MNSNNLTSISFTDVMLVVAIVAGIVGYGLNSYIGDLVKSNKVLEAKVEELVSVNNQLLQKNASLQVELIAEKKLNDENRTVIANALVIEATPSEAFKNHIAKPIATNFEKAKKGIVEGANEAYQVTSETAKNIFGKLREYF